MSIPRRQSSRFGGSDRSYLRLLALDRHGLLAAGTTQAVRFAQPKIAGSTVALEVRGVASVGAATAGAQGQLRHSAAPTVSRNLLAGPAVVEVTQQHPGNDVMSA